MRDDDSPEAVDVLGGALVLLALPLLIGGWLLFGGWWWVPRKD